MNVYSDLKGTVKLLRSICSINIGVPAVYVRQTGDCPEQSKQE